MTESGAASHASASEVAYHHLRAQILDGALLGGSMISEGMVANELGMSRTPVREAFLRLQGEGNEYWTGGSIAVRGEHVRCSPLPFPRTHL